MNEEHRVKQKAFEDRLSMCASDGWRDLIEEVNEFMEIVNTLDGVSTVEEVYLRKGKIEAFRWLIHLRDNANSNYDLLMENKDNVSNF